MTTISDKNSLEWHFAPFSGGSEKGPNDAQMETIKGNPWKGLIRESIQNSLDAVYDTAKPVLVKINKDYFTRLEFPELFNLRAHINECAKYFPKNLKAQEKFKEMEKVFSENSYQTIPFIQISDFNTKGMEYTENNTENPFYAFVRSSGVSVKSSERTGGSFGFGKSAYFKISPLRTIFVSTLTTLGAYTFEGVSWLCTHKYNGQKVVDTGFFDNNNGKPVTNGALIPQRFKRSSPGTSFYILGLSGKDWNKVCEEMIKETLQNFWMAIYSGKLEVTIGSCVIGKNNLDNMMEKYFPDDLDNTSSRTVYNPRPYFEIIRNAPFDNSIKIIEKETPILGKVSLYLKQINGIKDKVIYMRKPLMKVFHKKLPTTYNIYGVFLCTDPKGDKILQKLENPAHDEWKAANYTTIDNNYVAKGKEAEKELNEFIQNSIAETFSKKDKSALEILGLDELLYIPESLLDKKDKIINNMIIDKNNFQNPIQTISDTAKILENKLMSPGNVLITQSGSHHSEIPDSDNFQIMGTGNRQEESKTKGGSHGAGDKFAKNSINNENGTFKTYMPVKFRAFSNTIANTLYHKLVIYSPKNVKEAEIELFAAGDDTDEQLIIEYADKGRCLENRILDIDLKEGKNEFLLRFQDEQKHSIRLKTYENK